MINLCQRPNWPSLVRFFLPTTIFFHPYHSHIRLYLRQYECVVSTFKLYNNFPRKGGLGMKHFHGWHKFRKKDSWVLLIPRIVFYTNFFTFYSHVKRWVSYILMGIEFILKITTCCIFWISFIFKQNKF